MALVENVLYLHFYTIEMQTNPLCLYLLSNIINELGRAQRECGAR